LAELDSHLARRPVAVCGNFFTGLGLEDCVARSTAEAARLSGLLQAGA